MADGRRDLLDRCCHLAVPALKSCSGRVERRAFPGARRGTCPQPPSLAVRGGGAPTGLFRLKSSRTSSPSYQKSIVSTVCHCLCGTTPARHSERSGLRQSTTTRMQSAGVTSRRCPRARWAAHGHRRPLPACRTRGKERNCLMGKSLRPFATSRPSEPLLVRGDDKAILVINDMP